MIRALLSAALIAAPALANPYGQWRIAFAHPGGELPFNLVVAQGKAGPTATLVNGSERLKVEQVAVDGDAITLTFPSYNSRITLTAAGDVISGEARLIRSAGAITLSASGARGVWRFSPRPAKPVADVTGRWVVSYGDNKVRGLALLKQQGNSVTGTVQLPTGDTRFLAGELDGNQLKLSTFDGSYTNLWKATLTGNSLTGAQWSATAKPAGNGWTATREKGAAMAGVAVEAPGGQKLSFRLPTPDGRQISLDDPRYKGKVVVISIGGAWCPNCHDEALFLAPYATRRQAEGLEVIGMQFEYGTDVPRAMRQITSFAARYKIKYPMVLAGQPVPEDTVKVLGSVGPVKVYPTTIFIGRDGRVKEVHVGWSGPATGALNVAAKREFDETVTKLLKQKA
jgi:peroxiredoxin